MELNLAEGIFVGACALLIVLLVLMYCGVSCPPEGTPPPKPVTELPEVVQKLWFGMALYSQSFPLDFWMNLRNKHILFSCLLAHPLHPFSKMERLLVLVSTVLFAYGVASLAAKVLTLLLSSLPDDQAAAWYQVSNMSVSGELGSGVDLSEAPPLGVYDLVMVVVAMVVQVGAVVRVGLRIRRRVRPHDECGLDDIGLVFAIPSATPHLRCPGVVRLDGAPDRAVHLPREHEPREEAAAERVLIAHPTQRQHRHTRHSVLRCIVGHHSCCH